MSSRFDPSILPGAALAALSLSLGACAPDAFDDSDSLGTTRDQLAYDEAEINSQLPIDLPPGRGTERFDFCPMDRDLNLANARWLAWMSANAYNDHFGTWPGQEIEGISQVRYPGAIFSAFSALGFGNPGEDVLWVRAGEELADSLRRDPTRNPLASLLFTQLNPNRGMGKLSGTDPAGYEDGNFHFTAAGTQVYFIHNRRLRTALVMFRGTQPTEGNGADVVADLDYELVRLDDGSNPRDPRDGVQVHRGFRTALHETSGSTSNILSRLLRRLQQLPPGTQLWVTGHSLGGALANLFAVHALQEQQSARGSRYEFAGLVTFGAPEVGNDAFGAELRRRLMSAGALHQRFVYGRDPVPRAVEFGRGRILLFRELDAYQHATRVEDYGRDLFGREHGGGWEGAQYGSLEVQLPCLDSAAGRDGRLYSSPVPGSYDRCARGVHELLDGQADHAIRNYYDALVRAERALPAGDGDSTCEQTDGWRSACTRLTRCLSSLGGAGCAQAPRDGGAMSGQYARVVDGIRSCESDGDGGWACFQTYCSEAPTVPESVRTCWSANGGWSCFRPR
jgi:hypothetical protein